MLFQFTHILLCGKLGPQEQGMLLLKQNLTPAQQDQYTLHGYFDVIGGFSRKRYRIYQCASMNVCELRRQGKDFVSLCFYPESNLVQGDVMLAQKLMLELCELDALRIANKFPPRRNP